MAGQDTTSADRARRIDTGDTVHYRASSLTACPRAIVAETLGIPGDPTPAWMLEVFAEGHTAEEQIRAMTEDLWDGLVLHDQRHVEVDVGKTRGKRLVVTGHIDGAMHTPRGEPMGLLFEAKKFRSSTWDGFVRKGWNVRDSYRPQVSVYAHALGEEYGRLPHVVFVGGRWDSDAPDGEQVREVFVHTYNPSQLLTVEELSQMVRRLESQVHVALRKRDLGFSEEEIIGDVDCTGDYPCGWWRWHDEKKVTLVSRKGSK